MTAVRIQGGQPSAYWPDEARIGASIAKKLNHAEQRTRVRAALDSLRSQLFGKRVPHLDRLATLVFPAHPAQLAYSVSRLVEASVIGELRVVSRARP